MTNKPVSYRDSLIGFLARLRRDARGNTLAMMAAMLIPLAGFSGSAVDMGRLYAIKSRLQQACDAGALAGRKSMTATTLDTSPTGQAQTFFANNFHQGWFQTSAVSFTPSVTSDNQVAGTATATVPMTIMKMFGIVSKTVTVSCQARYDVADADIMFVLDTTGSMACLPSYNQSSCDSYDGGNVAQNSDGTYSVTEQSGSRISGVRSAVLNFFDTVTGQADSSTNFRFGFVPFSVGVNVGRLLQPLGYMATNWTYQSREVNSDANNGSPTTSTDTSKTTQTVCNGTAAVRAPTTALTYQSDGTATLTSWSWSNSKCVKSVQPLIPKWLYKPESGFNVSQFLASSASSPIDNPVQVTAATTYWQGCIEERDTDRSQPLTPSSSSPPLDLDVDTAPSSSMGSGSYWRPMWQDVEFARLSTNEISSATRTPAYRPYNSTTMADYTVYELLSCPLAAKRLTDTVLPASSSSTAKAAVRTSIQNYMLASNGYRPWGTTYLDGGITWGTRLLSPSGMFQADTAAWPGHNPPNRFLIFLTDGTMETNQYTYSSHGIEQYDGRVCGGCTPTSSPSSDTYHSNRFATACQIAKNHNITVFVILFGQSVSSLPTLFSTCASPGQAYYASDTTALNTAFSKIAQQVAMLRISR